MKILGLETSCDETGAAVIEGRNKNEPVRLLSNSLATSLAQHAVTGGIIPEVAAREQVRYILPVITEALKNAGVFHEQKPDIDAIAVTYGPGLIGSLLVGIETAKTLALLWDVPVIPMNHMIGHIYANWITNDLRPTTNDRITFPAIALVVSGGHTDLVLLKEHGNVQVIGGTRDDAAGECFDKIGRLLGLQYPAGATISRLAERGNPKAFQLPRPMWDSKNYDFSFSGLKTSVLNLIKKNDWKFDKPHPSPSTPVSLRSQAGSLRPPLKGEGTNQEQLLANLCASVQKAIVDVLVFKTISAVKEYKVKTLLLGGGVAANQFLRDRFSLEIRNLKLEIKLHVPPQNLCTDNAAMIAAAGFYNAKKVDWQEVTADPELYY